MAKRTKVALGILCFAAASFATLSESAYTPVYDADLNTGDSVHWTADNYYYLTEPVYIDSGCTLKIDAGTWIFGGSGTVGAAGDLASALCVARGGYLIAEGTATDPIVFTAKGDDPDDPYDLGPGAKSMWGGVAVLGHAEINNPDPVTGMHVIEGLDASDTRSYYGRADATQNGESSGSLKYISIRHGGAVKISNEEVNGLTMGGVGSGTTIDYIEVYANSDDGYEWFGGAVRAKHLVSAFVGDECFDYDEGWVGKGQFWFGINQEYEGDKGGEHDGVASSNPTRVFSKPSIYNVTYIGSGNPTSNTSGNSTCLGFHDSAGGLYYNTIMMDYRANAISSDADAKPWGADRTFESGIIWNVGDGTWSNIISPAGDTTYLKAASRLNRIVDPQIISVSRDMNSPFLDPRPCDTSTAMDTAWAHRPAWDGWVTTASAEFIGAFPSPSWGANSLWIKGWTALDETGVLVQDLYTMRRGYLGQNVAQLQFHTPQDFYNAGAKMYVNGADSSSFLSTLWRFADDCGYTYWNSVVHNTRRWGAAGSDAAVQIKIYNASGDTIEDNVVWKMR